MTALPSIHRSDQSTQMLINRDLTCSCTEAVGWPHITISHYTPIHCSATLEVMPCPMIDFINQVVLEGNTV